MFRTLSGTLLISLGAACGSDEAASPSAALSRFLEAMDRGSVNESARKEAFTLLDDNAQAALAERAHRAALVTGRTYDPWEMVAPGRFRLRFALAERGGMRASISGEHAIVHVRSLDGKNQASVPMVRAGGSWRVQLPVPAARRERESLPGARPALPGAATGNSTSKP